MPRFMIQMLLLFCIVSGWGVAVAAKMYKWVDENGETHFSQTPPIQDETPVAQDQIQVHTTSASVLVPTSVDGELYCGELKLPRASGKRRMSLKTLNDKVRYWSKTLERSKQALDRYLAPKRKRYSSSYRNKSTTFNEDLARYQKPVNEYQCAIDWANNKKESARAAEAEYLKERNKAQKDLDVATAQMHRLCGEEPEKYNEYSKKRERYLAWRKCTRKYGAVVREMRNKLNSVKRNYY